MGDPPGHWKLPVALLAVNILRNAIEFITPRIFVRPDIHCLRAALRVHVILSLAICFGGVVCVFSPRGTPESSDGLETTDSPMTTLLAMFSIAVNLTLSALWMSACMEATQTAIQRSPKPAVSSFTLPPGT